MIPGFLGIGGLIGLLGLMLQRPLVGRLLGWDSSPSALAAAVSLIGALFPAIIGLLALWLAVRIGRAGLFLRSRSRYGYCLSTARWMCVFFPFGTVIGLWTVFLLKREEIRASFADAEPEPPTS